MRLTIWFVLLFAVAVVAASTLGANDGLASFYWDAWRVDLSLNLFLLLLIGTCFLLVVVFQAVNALVGLPRRAHQWRVARRDRTGQAALREALAQYFGGRYTRAQKAAQRALAIQAETPELVQDNEFTVLGHLLAAGSAHRLQNRALRDEELHRALDLSQHSVGARSAEEGARLLAAEWALDDRDASRAIELLNELPLGVARRTHALRLRLQATRLGRQPQEALKTARLLVKHQADLARRGRRAAAHARVRVARHGPRYGPAQARLARARPGRATRCVHRRPRRRARRRARCRRRGARLAAAVLGPDRRARQRGAGRDRRGARHRLRGIGPEWLPRLEPATQALPHDGAVALAAGRALADRGLWGKARALLELAARRRRAARRGAPQGLDRARRTGRARGRFGARRAVLRGRGASRLNRVR